MRLGLAAVAFASMLIAAPAYADDDSPHAAHHETASEDASASAELDSIDPTRKLKRDGLAALDLKYGFQDFRFESPLTPAVRHKARERQVDGMITRLRLDPTKIGSVHPQIFLQFFAGRLEAVYIPTSDETQSRAVLAVLQKGYGPGEQPNEYLEKYVWEGKRVRMVYDENPVTHAASVVIISKKVSNQEDAHNSKADSNAAKKDL